MTTTWHIIKYDTINTHTDSNNDQYNDVVSEIHFKVKMTHDTAVDNDGEPIFSEHLEVITLNIEDLSGGFVDHDNLTESEIIDFVKDAYANPPHEDVANAKGTEQQIYDRLERALDSLVDDSITERVI